MRKIRLVVAITFLLSFMLLLLVFNYQEIKGFAKNKFGGIVINHTSRDIKVTDCIEDKLIPENKSSRDLDLFDVDYIYIEKPLKFEDKVYSDGVIKICDFASIKIVSEDDKIDSVQAISGVWLCKLLNDYRWSAAVDESGQ